MVVRESDTLGRVDVPEHISVTVEVALPLRNVAPTVVGLGRDRVGEVGDEGEEGGEVDGDEGTDRDSVGGPTSTMAASNAAVPSSAASAPS